jgi:hypothetical protein
MLRGEQVSDTSRVVRYAFVLRGDEVSDTSYGRRFAVPAASLP